MDFTRGFLRDGASTVLRDTQAAFCKHAQFDLDRWGKHEISVQG